jgi:preprotein translocase subunit SecA
MGLFDRFFGGFNKKEISRYRTRVEEINALEGQYEKLSDSALKAKTVELKERLSKDAKLDGLMIEAFAVVREASKRTLGQRHFDVQLMGGMVLHEGKIAEMKTGEGKTLAATLAAYLNALEGRGVHIVTVNDYLARRDGEWMSKIYHALGLTVGIIQNLGISYLFDPEYKPEPKEEDDENPAHVQMENLRPCDRCTAYAADITYGTNNEFGFDYLRDNMARDVAHLAQRDLRYAIVDEVDSILIDEARTPLIISAPAEESAALYSQFAAIVPRLKDKEDFELDEKDKAVSITDDGIQKVEQLLGVKGLYSASNIALVHHLEEALKAQVLFKKDRDYVVKDNEVIIVDEFTGRLMPGRRYSEGLHQAIEAKEGVEVQRESETLATVSFQNLFRLYHKLSGMTGTAETEAEEFHKIYKLEVVAIPTNKPMVRVDHHDLIYKTEQAKFNAIVERIIELHQAGQPVLIGTISITKSEILSRQLRQRGIEHEVLNAKNHEREAQIIAQAGRAGAVTVATNMAGRGVDIILGGLPKDEREHKEVVTAGGLYVIGTERHESRRIDNQLRGRSGRQGDGGASTFYISLEDDLMRIFAGERLRGIMNRLGLPDDQPIEHSLISRSIESAQRRVEGHNFDIRKHLVDYDDVANKQREIIYSRRRKLLKMDPLADAWLHEKILTLMSDEEREEYEAKAQQHGAENIRHAERAVYMAVIDRFWIEHLNTIEALRDSIGLRGYGQVDPLVVYKQESFKMFERLIHEIDDEVVAVLMKLEVQVARPPVLQPVAAKMQLQGADENLAGGGIQTVPSSQGVMPGGETENLPTPVEEQSSVPTSGVEVSIRPAGSNSPDVSRRSSAVSTPVVPKVGRNDPCPCGSGKKYKKCHGK